MADDLKEPADEELEALNAEVDVDLDDIAKLDDEEDDDLDLHDERAEFLENFPLQADDDVEELAENMGVIRNEGDELDVTRIDFTSRIDHSPPPDPAVPADLDDEQELDDIEDVETEVEDLEG